MTKSVAETKKMQIFTEMRTDRQTDKKVKIMIQIEYTNEIGGACYDDFKFSALRASRNFFAELIFSLGTKA